MMSELDGELVRATRCLVISFFFFLLSLFLSFFLFSFFFSLRLANEITEREREGEESGGSRRAYPEISTPPGARCQPSPPPPFVFTLHSIISTAEDEWIFVFHADGDILVYDFSCIFFFFLSFFFFSSRKTSLRYLKLGTILCIYIYIYNCIQVIQVWKK